MITFIGRCGGPAARWVSARACGHLRPYLCSAGAASGFSSDLGRTSSGCGLALGTQRGGRDDEVLWRKGDLGSHCLSDPGPLWPESSLNREVFAAPRKRGAGRVVRSGHPGANEDEAAVRKRGQGRGKDPEPFLPSIYLRVSPRGIYACVPRMLAPLCYGARRWVSCLC